MARRVAVLLVIGLLGCTPSSKSEPTPTSVASPAPTVSTPTEEPTNAVRSPVVIAPAGILPPGSVAMVTVDGLRVRLGRPGTTEFDQVIATLSEGDRVLVAASAFSYIAPESSPDGRGWYAVRLGVGLDSLFGYVAQGETELEYLVSETAPCPGPEPTIEQLLQFAQGYPAVERVWDRLACFGNEPLELEGMIDLICLGDGMYPFSFEPLWLAYPSNCIGLGVDNPDAQGFHSMLLPLRCSMKISCSWERGDLVELRGHFDDSAAASCRIEPPDFPGQLPEPTFLVLFCREQFVVDQLTVSGHHDLPPQY